jgi:hypothetical protein
MVIANSYIYLFPKKSVNGDVFGSITIALRINSIRGVGQQTVNYSVVVNITDVAGDPLYFELRDPIRIVTRRVVLDARSNYPFASID